MNYLKVKKAIKIENASQAVKQAYHCMRDEYSFTDNTFDYINVKDSDGRSYCIEHIGSQAALGAKWLRVSELIEYKGFMVNIVTSDTQYAKNFARKTGGKIIEKGTSCSNSGRWGQVVLLPKGTKRTRTIMNKPYGMGFYKKIEYKTPTGITFIVEGANGKSPSVYLS